MPALSVITINFNNALGLEKTITSVISQTFKDFEYIVIDGKSTDGSKDILEKYTNHITYWISEKDTGVYHAMNKGIEKATGTYLLFLNSGDYLYNSSVLKSVFEKKYTADILYGDMMIVDKTNIQKHMKMPRYVGARRLFFDTVWHPVSFIKRELFLKYGKYDESYKIVSDYEFFVRVIVGENSSRKKIPFIISIFDTSGMSSDKSNVPLILEERGKIQKKYFHPFTLKMLTFLNKIR